MDVHVTWTDDLVLTVAVGEHRVVVDVPAMLHDEERLDSLVSTARARLRRKEKRKRSDADFALEFLEEVEIVPDAVCTVSAFKAAYAEWRVRERKPPQRNLTEDKFMPQLRERGVSPSKVNIRRDDGGVDINVPALRGMRLVGVPPVEIVH